MIIAHNLSTIRTKLIINSIYSIIIVHEELVYLYLGSIYMDIKEKIISVIREAYPYIKQIQDDCFVIGSAALILSGVEIENTFDIDIVTSNRDADFLRKEWKERFVDNHISKHDNLFRSNFSRYNFDILDIEIMGNLKVYKNSVWEPLIIQDYIIFSENEIKIKLPTIKEQKRILEWFGRDKDMIKLNLIKKQLYFSI